MPGAPQLVVIPFQSEALAVTRYEVSVAEFREFCIQAERSDCVDGDSLEPVANVSVDDAISYAVWLSAASGFNYRLPDLEEWSALASVGAAGRDANRNCLIDVGGVSRGGAAVRASVGTPNDFGVVNALGNVAEWVTTAEGLLSVGGHFNEPLERCIEQARAKSDGAPALTQGIRLVRELSVRTGGSG